jgi:site-specific DNA-cytosine methylase
MKVGELFSGCGGFSLGFEATNGIETAWHCEIDPDARSVLKRHWPAVPCYTDVTALNGAELEPVDVITFGSPCQDLSIAGNRHGLDGSRSNLFFEACRIIEEMRNATEFRFPRYAVWENVSGALSSKKGDDFARALDELADIGAVVIEWQVLNSLYFGVAQRRRRVFVVACFDPGADGLGEILPVAESLRGDIEASITARTRTASGARNGPLATSGVVQGLTCSYGKGGPDDNKAQAGWLIPDSVGPLLAGGEGGRGHRVGADEAAAGHIVPVAPDSVPTLTSPRNGARYDDQETQQLVAYGLSENQRAELYLNEDHVRSITNGGGKPGQGYPAIAFSIYPESGQGADLRAVETSAAPSINATDGVKVTDRGLRIVCPMHGAGELACACEKDGPDHPLQLVQQAPEAETVSERPSGGSDGVQTEALLRPDVHEPRVQAVVQSPPIRLGVRRLTPTECERLMGWPDGHTARRTDGKAISDSSRYRLIGNGVVSSVAEWIGHNLLRVDNLL